MRAFARASRPDQAFRAGRTARLVAQLAGALDAAHAYGLVHRDVKPANVLLTLDRPEHLYLTDFGVAKTIGSGDGLTQAGDWVGTLDYVAPEQIKGEAVGAAADTYAMAAVIYHCLSGQVPFDPDHEAAKLFAHLGAPRRLRPRCAPSSRRRSTRSSRAAWPRTRPSATRRRRWPRPVRARWGSRWPLIGRTRRAYSASSVGRHASATAASWSESEVYRQHQGRNPVESHTAA